MARDKGTCKLEELKLQIDRIGIDILCKYLEQLGLIHKVQIICADIGLLCSYWKDHN